MNNQMEEEEPLDPVMERVRVKMVRLLGISIGLMLIALLTVLGAVIYKINQPDETSNAENGAISSQQGSWVAGPVLEAITVDLPDGARVSQTSLSGNRLLINIQLADQSRELRIIDLETGKQLSRITLDYEAD